MLQSGSGSVVVEALSASANSTSFRTSWSWQWLKQYIGFVQGFECVSRLLPVKYIYSNMEVSINGGTPKSSILVAFSIIKPPIWEYSPISENPHVSNHWSACHTESYSTGDSKGCCSLRSTVNSTSSPRQLSSWKLRMEVEVEQPQIQYPLVNSHNYGKSPFLMEK